MVDDIAAAVEAVGALSNRERVLIAAYRGYDGAMAMQPDKPAALRDAAQALDALGVAYALIGGVAVGIHTGVPRATLDIDLAVRSQLDRAAVIAAMQGAGFVLVGSFAHSANFRHASGEPVQLAFDPRFDPMIERAAVMSLGSIRARVLAKDDLIESKRIAAADPARRRSKALRDRADLAMLEGDVGDPDEGW